MVEEAEKEVALYEDVYATLDAITPFDEINTEAIYTTRWSYHATETDPNESELVTTHCNFTDQSNNKQKLKQEKMMSKDQVVRVTTPKKDRSTGSFYTSETLEVGDYVVVNMGDEVSGRKWAADLAVGKVVKSFGLTARECEKASSFIVAKIDFAAYEMSMKRQALKQEIRNKLREARAEQEEFVIYEMLAKNNPEIATLLNEYTELSDTTKAVKDNYPPAPKRTDWFDAAALDASDEKDSNPFGRD